MCAAWTESYRKMSQTNFKTFLYALWIFGFFPVDHPLNYLSSSKKNRFTIRRILIAAWSLILLIYPAIFHLDIWFSARVFAPAENQYLSTIIPWLTSVGSTVFGNAIVRLFGFLNYGNLVQLVESLRLLTLHHKTDVPGMDVGFKWRHYYMLWLVSVGQSVGVAYRIVRDLVTNEYELKGLTLALMPEPDIVRIIVMDVMVSAIVTMTPIFLFHLVVALGLCLMQIHASIYTELSELLLEKPGMSNLKIIKNEPCSHIEIQVSLLQEKFAHLKECFKIYDQLAGTYLFYIIWWGFVIIFTVFSTLSSEVLRTAEVFNFGIWSLAFVYLVASFGEYMASSLEHGREVISDTMGRLKRPRILDNELPELVRH